MEFAEFIKTPKVDRVTLHRPNNIDIEGTLCVTGHHLILSSRQDHKEELWLLHKAIDSIEKKLIGAQGRLSLKCKDFEIIQLEFSNVDDCLNVALSVENLANIENINLAYPFFYRPMFEIFEDGWQAYLPETEYSRVKSHTDEWRLSHVNKNFEVCHTYPQAVVVPKSVSDEILIQSASFRHGGRFPVLSYYHKENGMSILRSGQPMAGPNNRRCKEDAELLNAVLGIGKRGYILDTRSTNIAKLAQAKGGGVEPEMHYSQWRRVHQAIDRSCNLQESLIKLIEACCDYSSSMDKWLSRLDASGWMSSIKDTITCACVAAQCIDKEGASVLVHGSEGTDTTLLVTSLAQLILDPDCRTIRGLEALIEREWLQGGHPFSDRCSKSAFAVTKNKTDAPTFLLFLDCCWQIWQQFPLSFEFNEEFLLMMFKNSYASQFGTFMCNSDMERKKIKLEKKTVSLWSYINRPEILSQYMNPLYEPNQNVIWPSVAPQSLQIWERLYLPFLHFDTSDVMWDEIKQIKEKDSELKSKVIKMRKQVATLEKEAIDIGLIQVPVS